MSLEPVRNGAGAAVSNWSLAAHSSLRRAHLVDRLATIVMWLAAVSLAVVLFGIVGLILFVGLPVLSLSFLFTSGDFMNPGIGPQIWVTVYTLALTLLMAAPIGIAAAVYLSEFASDNWFTATIRFSTEALASVPSIVFGIFGSIVFLTMLHLGYSVVSGSLTLALLNLPLMVRVSEDAIRRVPQAYREASYALAANRWETISKIVIPAALPGLFTAVVLTAGRIIGETAPLILTMGTTISPNAYYSLNPFSTGETLAVHIWVIKIIGMPGVPNAEAVANGSAATLLLIVLFTNVLAAFFTGRLQQRLSGRAAPARAGGVKQA